MVPAVQHPQLRHEGQLLERAVLPFPGRLVVVVRAWLFVVVVADALRLFMGAKLEASSCQGAAQQGPEAEVVQTLVL